MGCGWDRYPKKATESGSVSSDEWNLWNLYEDPPGRLFGDPNRWETWTPDLSPGNTCWRVLV